MSNEMNVQTFEGQALADLKEKMKADLYPNRKEGHCLECNEVFSNKNCHSAAGWKETQISGICENCFDRMFGG